MITERFAKSEESLIMDLSICNATFRVIAYMRLRVGNYIFRKKNIMADLDIGLTKWKEIIKKLNDLGLVRYNTAAYGYEYLPVDKLGGVGWKTTQGGRLENNPHTHIEYTQIDLNIPVCMVRTAREALPVALPGISTKTKIDRELSKGQLEKVAALSFDEHSIYTKLISWGIFKANALVKASRHSAGDIRNLIEAAENMESTDSKRAYFLGCYENWKNNNYRHVDYEQVLKEMRNAKEI
jgi:hypothetical protein